MTFDVTAAQAKVQALLDQGTAIYKAAADEGRDLSSDEMTMAEMLVEDIQHAKDDLERQKSLAQKFGQLRDDLTEATQRQTAATMPKETTSTSGNEWSGPGEWLQAVANAGKSGGDPGMIDRRLMATAPGATTVGTTEVGADGGFTAPDQFSADILAHAMNESLLELTDMITMTGPGNSMLLPSDESTPWGSSGVRAYWKGEAAAGTQTKPSFSQVRLEMDTLFCLVPVSDELLADGTALGQTLPRLMGRAIRWETDDGILNGNAGSLSGILNHASLISVAKETDQDADTIVSDNLVKMMGRFRGNPSTARWIMSHDSWPQLPLADLGVNRADGGLRAGTPIMLTPNGLSQMPYGTILGIPVVKSEACQTVGDLGDIYLADMAQYKTLTRGAPTTDVSMHVFFDAGATAFRTSLRVGGQPWAAAATAAAYGSSTTSGFVALAARGA